MVTQIMQYFTTRAVLIIGARIGEMHITKFASDNVDKLIITIDEQASLADPGDNQIHYTTDFNDTQFWSWLFGYLENQNINVVSVIVDVSTAKHMNSSWEFTTGENIKIIFRLLKKSDGCFISPCCGTGYVGVNSETNVREYDTLNYLQPHPLLKKSSTFEAYKKELITKIPVNSMLTWEKMQKFPLENKNKQIVDENGRQLYFFGIFFFK